jgi:predicted dehydrogenase
MTEQAGQGMVADRKVRLGFIGAGWWATVNHMPLLRARDDVEMVAVARRDPALLARVQEEFGFEHALTDYRALLELDLDGVVVSSPHAAHHEHAAAALRTGAHVLCEKPMTLDPAQAWELVGLARERDRHLLVPYGWHYKPFVVEAKRLMDEGAVGEVQYALCHMASPTKGFFAGGGGPPEHWQPTIASPDPGTWQLPERGGGYAHGQVTHSSALLFWLTGLRAATVSALMTRPDSRVDMYDAAAVVFDTGAIGAISGAATLPDNDKFQVDIRVFGSEGVLLLDVERERLEVRRHDGRHVSQEVPPGDGAYSCEVPPVRFVELIRGEGRNDSPGEIAARTVELIEAMHRSAAQGGRPVDVWRPA